jgi:hypothetical protein
MPALTPNPEVHRGIATGYDKLAENHLAFVKLASIHPVLRAYESTRPNQTAPCAWLIRRARRALARHPPITVSSLHSGASRGWDYVALTN